MYFVVFYRDGKQPLTHDHTAQLLEATTLEEAIDEAEILLEALYPNVNQAHIYDGSLEHMMNYYGV